MLSSTTPLPSGAQVEVVYVPIGGAPVAEKGGMTVIAHNR